MAEPKPQLTWANILAGIVAIGLLVGGGYTIIQNQFEYVRQSARQTNDDVLKQIELIRHGNEQLLSLREHAANMQEQENANNAFRSRLTVQETALRDLLARTARAPVEAKEVDVLSAAIDKRFEAVQQQINDINRQIAASILTPGGVLHVPIAPQPPPR